MEARTKPIVILMGAALIFLISAVIFGLPQVRRAAQIGAAARAQLHLEQWARAAEAYRQAHGAMPVGDASAVLGALRSASASREVIPRPGFGDQEWQLLDPWGTPWRIQDGERIEVRSAGPNRRFGDEDDFSSLRLRRE